MDARAETPHPVQGGQHLGRENDGERRGCQLRNTEQGAIAKKGIGLRRKEKSGKGGRKKEIKHGTASTKAREHGMREFD